MKAKAGIHSFVLSLLSSSLALAAPSLTTLAFINDMSSDAPIGGVILDSAGNLYGLTGEGGPSDKGTVYEIPAGTHTLNVLAAFNGSNGSIPLGGLVMDSAGDLYGTTSEGGSTANNGHGYGTVFEVAAGSNTITTLAAFNGTNGTHPSSDPIIDAAGNLYGTTSRGGVTGFGTVFEVAAGSNAITTLATFNSSTGQIPWGGLAADARGNLYGVTLDGGSNNVGTVFEVSEGSHSLTTLASFGGNINNPGFYSPRSPIVDAAGNVYGITWYGGVNGAGVIFEVAAGSHAITTLASFNGSNGKQPDSALIADAVGNLYGTTFYGGAHDGGTVFKIAADTHTITTLATFAATDAPYYLAADSVGNLYGTEVGTGDVFEVTNTGFVVPEPASLSLLGIGALGVLFRRQRM